MHDQLVPADVWQIMPSVRRKSLPLQTVDFSRKTSTASVHGLTNGSLQLKCVQLRFCTQDRPLHIAYQIYDGTVESRESHRDLGVVVSADMSWSAHYDHLASHSYKLLGLLRRTFSAVESVSARRTLFTTIIRPKLLYCSQVWRLHLVKDILKIEKVQRRASKFILHDYTSDYRARFEALDLLPEL